MEVTSSLGDCPSHKSNALGRKVEGKGSTKGNGKRKSVHSVEEYAWSGVQQRPSPARGRQCEPHSAVWETTTHSAPQATFGTVDVSSVLGDAKIPS